MGDVGAFVLAIGAVLIGLRLLLGWINYKIDKLKEEDKSNIEMIGSIIALEKAVKKLNEALKIHEHRLDHARDDIYGINERLDILEEGHPDTDIDYGEVDDQSNVVCVWFHGKKYVPEDKRDENTSTFYADNKVVAETSRPDPQPESRYTCADCVRFRRERVDGKWRCVCSTDNVVMSDDELYICDKFRLYKTTGEIINPEETRCCVTCQHYRPESGYSTCDFSTWLHVTKKYATMTDSACHNYEKAYSGTKGQVDYPYIQYKNMGGNGRAEELPKYIVKLNYLASGTECDELLKRVERLNRIYDAGLMSLSEYGERLKEWMQNDT